MNASSKRYPRQTEAGYIKGSSKFERNKNSTLFSLKAQLQYFYIYDLNACFKKYKRSLPLSLVLISIYYLQLLSQFLSQEVITKLKSTQTEHTKFIQAIHQYLYYFKLYPIYGELSNNEYNSTTSLSTNKEFLLAIASLNIALFLYILIRFGVYIAFQFSKDVQQEEESFIDIKQQIRISNFPATLQLLFVRITLMASFIFRIYPYVIVLPAGELSLMIAFIKDTAESNRSTFEQLLGIFTLISTFGIYILIQIQEFDYSIKIRDHLSQKRTLFKYSQIASDFCSCCLQLSTSLIAQSILFALNIAVKLTLLLTRLPFNQVSMMLCSIAFCLLSLGFQTSFVISSNLQTHSSIDFSLLLICWIPICMKLAFALNELSQNKNGYNLPFLGNNYKDFEATRLDRYIRQTVSLFELTFEEYMKNSNGIKFESIYANHIDTCKEFIEKDKQYQFCFCNKFDAYNCSKKRTSDSSMESYQSLSAKQKNKAIFSQLDCQQQIQEALNHTIGHEFRMKFMIQYINTSIRRFFQASKKNAEDQELEIQPTYVYFLLQIAKSPTKAFQQIYFLKEKMKKQSLISRSLIYEMIADIKFSFNEFMRSCPFQNQRLKLSLVFTLDEQYREFLLCMKEGISSKQKFYEFLSSDFININELAEQSTACLKSVSEIENQMMKLFHISPNNLKIHNIHEIYSEFFDFKKKKLRYFIRNSQNLMKKSLQKIDFKINLFEKNSCTVFVSFHTRRITNASDSATSFFHLQSISDLIGRNFGSFFPSFLSLSFTRFIEQLLDEGNMDPIKIGEFFTFMLSPYSKLIKPIFLRAKVDVIQGDEFGMSIMFNKTRKFLRNSIVIDQNFVFESCTAPAFKMLFSKFQQKRSVKSIEILKKANLKNFIPLLYCLGDQDLQVINGLDGYNEQSGFKDQRALNFTVHSSIMILPTKQSDLLKLQVRVRENPIDLKAYFESLQNGSFMFFEVSFSIFCRSLFSHEKEDIVIINIENYKKLTKPTEIEEFIAKVSEQLSNKFAQPFQFPILQEKSIYKARDFSKKMSLYNVQSNDYLSDTTVRDEVGLSQRSQGETSFVKIPISFEKQNPSSPLENSFADSTLNLNRINFRDAKPQNLRVKVIREDESMVDGRVPLTKRNYQNEDSSVQLSIMNDNEQNGRVLLLSSPTATSPTRLLVSQRSNYKNNEIESSYDNTRLIQQSGEADATAELYQVISYSSNNLSSSQKQNSNGFESDRLLNNILNHQKKDAIIDVYNDHSSNSSSKSSSSSENDGDHVYSMKNTMNDQSHSQEGGGVDTKTNVAKKATAPIGDDQQSVRTGQSQAFSKKQSISEILISKRESPQIYYSRISGYFAFAFLICITCLLYFQMSSNFTDLWRNYSNLTLGLKAFFVFLSKGPQMSECFTQVLRMKEILTLISVNQKFGFLTSVFQLADQSHFYSEAQAKQANMTTFIGQLERSNILQGFEDILLGNKTSVIYPNQVNLLIQIKEWYSRLYTIEQFISNFNDYLYKGDSVSRAFAYLNYDAFVSSMTKLSGVSQENALNKLKSTEQILDLSIIFIEIISFASVILVFPIYYAVQVKKQEILNLLVTFDPQLLQSLILKHRDAQKIDVLSQTQIVPNEMIKSMKFQTFSAKNTQVLSAKRISSGTEFHTHPQNKQQKNKKRSISQTSSIQKCSFTLVFSAAIVFALISIYSVLNYVLTVNFFSLFHFHIEEISFVQETLSFFSLNYTALYLLMNSYVYKFSDGAITNLLAFYTDNQFLDNQRRIEYMYQLDSHFIDSRYQIDDYKDNFLSIFQTNACDMLKSSFATSYLAENDKFVKAENCKTIASGLLTKGITVALKNLYGKIQTLVSNYALTRGNILAFFGTLKKWDYENNIKEFENLYYYIRVIFQAQSAFLIDQSDQYFKYLSKYSDILFVYSLCIITITFWIIWRKFIRTMTLEIINTTQVLTIMPLEHLLDNPYVISYINKQKKYIRKKM